MHGSYSMVERLYLWNLGMITKETIVLQVVPLVFYHNISQSCTFFIILSLCFATKTKLVCENDNRELLHVPYEKKTYEMLFLYENIKWRKDAHTVAIKQVHEQKHRKH